MAFKSFLVVLLSLVAMAGCQAKVGALRNVPAAQQQAVLARLTTGSYDIHTCPGVVVIAPKNLDASLEIVGSGCRQLAEATGLENVELYADTGLREVVGPEGQVLGYVSHDLSRTQVGVGKGDKGAVRLYISRRHSGR